MLKGILQSMNAKKEWGSAHEIAWENSNTLDTDRLSQIQKRCLAAALEKNLVSEHEAITEEDIKEKVLILKSKNSKAYFKIYNGDAELGGVNEFFHVEQCGCLNPEEFVNQVISKLQEYQC